MFTLECHTIKVKCVNMDLISLAELSLGEAEILDTKQHVGPIEPVDSMTEAEKE